MIDQKGQTVKYIMAAFSFCTAYLLSINETGIQRHLQIDRS